MRIRRVVSLFGAPLLGGALLVGGVDALQAQAGGEADLAGVPSIVKPLPATSAGARVAGSASARTPAAASLPADLRALIDAIQARYDGLRDFKADFTQESRVQAAPSAQKAGGQIYFQKPGRMRWNYRTPEPQEIVINGGKLWQYVPDDRQVVIQGFDAARVEYTFLTGVGDLERDFKIRWANPRKRPGDPLVYVRLVPRNEDATFSEVMIGVDPRDHRILATEVNDLFGNTTIIRFQNYKNNVGLARSLFAFTTPKGVDVIDNTAAAGTRTR